MPTAPAPAKLLGVGRWALGVCVHCALDAPVDSQAHLRSTRCALALRTCLVHKPCLPFVAIFVEAAVQRSTKLPTKFATKGAQASQRAKHMQPSGIRAVLRCS
jgi:hypothetical protein